MKYWKSILVIGLLFLGSTLMAQQVKPVSSQIKTVSVFINQAQIERVAKLNLEEGVYTLVFEKISPVLVNGSIEVKAPEGIEILGVSTQNDYTSTHEKPAALLALEDSLALVLEQLQEVKADKEAIAWQRDLLLSNKNIGGANQGVKAEELEDMLTIYERKLKEFKSLQIALDRREKQLNKQRELIELQMNEYLNGQKAYQNQILVQVKVNKLMADAQFDLRYLVGEVRWSPMYDIRVKDTKSPVQFVLRANIMQSTGENWDNVHLKLSTSNPMEGAVKPELQTFFLEFKAPAYGARGNKMNAPAAPVEDKAVSLGTNYWQPPVQQQSFLNLSFEVPGMSSVSSDDKDHVIDLSRFTLNANYGLALVPSLSPEVFVTAKIQSNDLINQLNGEANIYLNGTFTGKTFLSQQAGDTLLITLGKDRRIVAKREKVKEMCSKSLFGSTRKSANTIEISISNSSAEDLMIQVEDQIPVSANSEISVKLVDAGGASFNAENGFLTWKTNLGAKQSVKLRFSYEVSYPADKVIVDY